MTLTRTNYCTNPSLETDAHTDTLADGWSYTGGGGITNPTYSKVAALAGSTGAVAQRITVTVATAGDGVMYFKHVVTGITAGDVFTFSFLATGAVAGGVPAIEVHNQAWTRAVLAGITLTGGVVRYSATATAPAASTALEFCVLIYSLGVGSTIDITLDDVLIEKAASLGDYFDGSYDNCEWNGVAHASTSRQEFLPTVTTTPVTEITSISAASGGNVTDVGSQPVTARGVCWSTAASPTTADDHTSDGSGLGAFTSALTGLEPYTTYYVRAYATNSVGTAYGNEVSFRTYVGASQVRVKAKAEVSLLVGSAALGYQELGPAADLDTMVKAMPGGDGSLTFALHGDAAWRYRNVIVPITSRVVLRINGEPIWGGRIVSDPLRHRLGPQDSIQVDSAGVWSLASRDESYGYIGKDTDLDQWIQLHNTAGDYSGRFTVQKEDFLELRGHGDRTYPDGARAVFYYWCHDGLTDGSGVALRFDFEYKLNLPVGWRVRMWVGSGGPLLAAVDPGSGYPWVKVNADSPVSAWTPDSVAAAGDTIVLQLESVGDNSSENPWVRIRRPVVVGTGFDSTPWPCAADTIGNALRVLAFNSVGVYGGIDATLDAAVYEQFVARFPTTISDTIAAASLLYDGPTECFFGVDANGNDCFTGRVRPDADSLAAGNRLWVVGGRAGEDTSDLKRDFETTPERIEVVYACLEDADYPDATVRIAAYQPNVAPLYPRTEVVSISEESLMTYATALAYAKAIYENRHSRLYSGSVTVPQTAYTASGNEEPTYRMKPGDRLHVTDRDDTGDERLYVAQTSYHFPSQTATPTIGEPWSPREPKGSSPFRGRRSPRNGRMGYKTRRGIA